MDSNFPSEVLVIVSCTYSLGQLGALLYTVVQCIRDAIEWDTGELRWAIPLAIVVGILMLVALGCIVYAAHALST